MSNSERNGFSRFIWWVTTGAVGALLAIAWSLYADVNGKVQKQEDDLQRSSERIVAVETRYADIARRLDNIEKKLDVLLSSGLLDKRRND